MIKQFCTFYLNKHYFGIDVALVQEVMLGHVVEPVHLASSIVSGLINLRGQIVTVIDLHKRLGLDYEQLRSESTKYLVIKSNDNPVSLIVDSIDDVLDVSDDLFEAPPTSLENSAKEFIVGAYKLDTQLLLILDVEKSIDLGSVS